MRCSRCGGQIGNTFVKTNGMILCENCARELKIDEVFRRQADIFNQAFPSLDVFPNVFSLGNDLEFTGNKISCPRCGTTLRDIEQGGQLGCIECYNTFNESIMKNILKLQGSSEYMGRKPGTGAEVKITAPVEEAMPEAKPEAKPAVKTETKAAAEAPAEQAEPKKDNKELLETLMKADLGTVSDEKLEEGMKMAAQAEDYTLAARLRDELKSRKGGN